MTSWVRFHAPGGGDGFGMLVNDRVLEYEGDMFGESRATGVERHLDDLVLASPCMPSKVVALWNNFYALASKLDKAPPTHPLFLIKPSTSVIPTTQPILRPASYAGKIAYEGELGIVIGRRCANVEPEQAGAYIFGYTCINDVTAIELLGEDPNFAQWCRAKGFDTFSCIGPVIRTDFDWRSARVVTHVDDAERQNYPLADMIFSPEAQVSMLSQDMTLMPGDVIACGTSIGVGSIKDGSSVTVSIDGIGTLRNTLEAKSLAKPLDPCV
jgi:2-keto-4-pentenoate hydratase/2-oxohepta-3-ene-1,7-dioic acid hydratase in catechol pathway